MFRERKVEKLIKSHWFIVGLVVIFLLLSIAYGRAYYQDYQIRSEITRLKEEAKKLETKKITSLEILEYVKSESFVEEKARTELNLAKEGEKVAIIRSENQFLNNNGQASEPVVKFSIVSNIRAWWNYFFGPKSE